jgi:NAD(P)-dependent dehydrogenase (short-subunit alcohol dehydrogenase family)
MDPTPFSGRALVTGGASGLGLGCARRFRDLGYAVTIADVDQAAGRAAVAELNGTARFEPLDLADPASIAALAAREKARGEPLDVLVNNAGIYAPSRRTLSPEGHELTFAIAHLGHFRLTHALWPLLAAAPAARIVTISSLVQRRSQLYLDDLTLARNYAPIRAYGQAKLACLLFAIGLQQRLAAAGSAAASYAAHPGVCRTQLGARRPRTTQDNAWQRFSSWALAWGMRHYGQTPEQGAEPVVQAATTARFAPGSFLGPKGFLEAAGPVGIVQPGPAASNPALAAELWRRSEALTGIQWTM